MIRFVGVGAQDPMNSPSFIVGNEVEGITLTVHGRPPAGSRDFWDGNWLTAQVTFRLGKFGGMITGDIRAEDIVTFESQLKALYRTLNGTADFMTMEDWLAIKLSGDGLGHIECAGYIMDYPGIGNRLAFRFQIDQTYLLPLLGGLEAIQKQYTIIGQP
jgi:hypothetical protein